MSELITTSSAYIINGDSPMTSVANTVTRSNQYSDWVNAPSARSWHLYHVLHGQIDFGDAETAYYSSETM